MQSARRKCLCRCSAFHLEVRFRETMLMHPLTGVGLITSTSPGRQWLHKDQAAHNTWLQIGAEMGFPGLLIFGAAALRCGDVLSSGVRGEEDLQIWIRVVGVAALGAVAGACTCATFLSEAYTWPLYFLLAIAAAVGKTITRTAAGSRPRSTQAGTGIRRSAKRVLVGASGLWSGPEQPARA